MKENVLSCSSGKRNYGIDLLRFVAMAMVAVLHVIGQGGILNNADTFTSAYFIAWFLKMAGYCTINCYALISGYVGINSKFRYSGILHMYLQVVYYTLITTAIFAVLSPETVGIKVWLGAVFPFAYGGYWYYTAYFCMSFFIPVLNEIIHRLDKKTCTLMVSMFLLVLSVIPMVFHKDIAVTNRGYCALWLSVLYLTGAYIKKYNIGSNMKKRTCALVYLGCVVFLWLSKISIDFLTSAVIGKPVLGDYFAGHTSPFVVLCGVMLLILFSKLSFSEAVNKVIAFITPLVFSIYLIHTEPLIWEYVIKERYLYFLDYNAFGFILAVALASSAILLAGLGIDAVRYYLFKLLKVKGFCEKVDGFFKNLVEKAIVKIKTKKLNK